MSLRVHRIFLCVFVVDIVFLPKAVVGILVVKVPVRMGNFQLSINYTLIRH